MGDDSADIPVAQVFDLETCTAAADEQIKTACSRVAALSLSSKAGLFIPGAGDVLGHVMGPAVSAGAIAKLESYLCESIAKSFGITQTKEQKINVDQIARGKLPLQTETNIQDMAIANFKQEQQLQAGSKSILDGLKNQLSKEIPFTGAAMKASKSMSKTFLVGKRAKSYFTYDYLMQFNHPKKNALLSDLQKNGGILTSKDQMFLTSLLAKTMSEGAQKAKATSTKLNDFSKQDPATMVKTVTTKGKDIMNSKEVKGAFSKASKFAGAANRNVFQKAKTATFQQKESPKETQEMGKEAQKALNAAGKYASAANKYVFQKAKQLTQQDQAKPGQKFL